MQRMVMVCVVRCGEVRRSEKVVRRKKRKEKEKERKEKKEREKKKRKQEKKIFSLSVLEQYF